MENPQVPKAMAVESESRNWLDLPRDVTAAILSRLGVLDILNSAQGVCSLWRSICKDPSMWRSIDMNYQSGPPMPEDVLQILCMRAVDQSCGGLVDINIASFGTNELLAYITDGDRSSQLKRLRLVSCYISGEGLSQAASKLPLLEVLEIYNCSISKEALEAVGRCCPLLRSLKLNSRGFTYVKCDEAALAIAQNMHGLQNLQIFGNSLTNVGLQAIVDGCPQLESLDLRHCRNVNLVGDLEKRCVEQIKDLRRPDDSICDYEFRAELYEDWVPFEYSSDISDLEDMFDEDGDYFEWSEEEEFDDMY